MNDNFYNCNTVDDMLTMARMPLSVTPTVAGAVRNIHLPLNADDKAWLASPEVHVFRATEKASNIAYRNVSGPTFTPDDPLIVTGVSVMVYPEPMSCVIEGNIVTGTDTLASPAVPTDADKMAHLEFGGPTWRFMWAFMHAYQLQFNCPQTQFEQLISERLVDIGNVSSRMELSGLSNAMTSHLKIVRGYNRLAKAEGHPYFLPLNCNEVEADASSFSYTPYRTRPVPAAYGQPNSLPAIETWHRLPLPMPLDHNTKISLFLRPSAGDEDYHARMLEEGEIVNDYGEGATRSGGVYQIPTGLIRIGLGLKGYQVREGVCHAWKRSLSNKALSQQLMDGGDLSPLLHDYAGSLSGPSDRAAKIIDQVAASTSEG